MGLLDKFLDAIKLNDDYYDDDDDFLDDDFDDDFEDEKPKRRFLKKSDDFLDDDFDDAPSKSAAKENKTYKQTAAASSTYKKTSSKVTPMRKKGTPSMEVNVVRPATMEDGQDIADTLMNSCTVVLNLEGVDIDVAQRIIDFTCGACYSLGGSIQKISGYIYILTPAGVDISGDYQEILGSAYNSSMKANF